MTKKVFIVGASSDIGFAIAKHWLKQKHVIYGTYREKNCNTDQLLRLGAKLICLDLDSECSRKSFSRIVSENKFLWDYLIICPGTMLPIGNFAEVKFDDWKSSFDINFFGPMWVTQELLPFRNRSRLGSLLVFVAGGGVNSAPIGFSSYVIGKLALIKATEYLDAEVSDLRTLIFGPGWINTNIHNEVLHHGSDANYAVTETNRRLKENDFTSMESVLSFLDWAIQQDKNILNGRNFSSRDDEVKNDKLIMKLLNDPNYFKLRRLSS